MVEQGSKKGRDSGSIIERLGDLVFTHEVAGVGKARLVQLKDLQEAEGVATSTIYKWISDAGISTISGIPNRGTSIPIEPYLIARQIQGPPIAPESFSEILRSLLKQALESDSVEFKIKALDTLREMQSRNDFGGST